MKIISEEALGSEEITREKNLFLVFLLFVFGFLFWALIGVAQLKGTVLNILLFYIAFGLFATIFILVDYFVIKKERPLDTITIEDEAPIKLSLKAQLILSAILGVGVFFWISTTGQAFVNAPTFQVFETRFAQAFLSGIVGAVPETLVFFSVLAPTLYLLINYWTDNKLFALLAFFVGGTFLFFIFHLFTYFYDQPALFSVAMFGFINLLLLYLFRSVLPLMSIHFFNNFAVVYFSVTQFVVIL